MGIVKQSSAFEQDKVREMMLSTVNYIDLSSLIPNDMANGKDVPAVSRRKRRLDNLSPEEKLRRKKLKNREAAQSSRDRKKAYMVELENAVKELRTQNNKLVQELSSLKKENQSLQARNQELVEELGHKTEGTGELSKPAALRNPLQKGSPVNTSVMSLNLILHLLISSLTSMTSTGSQMTPQTRPTLTSWTGLHRASSIRPNLRTISKSKKKTIWWGAKQKTWNPKLIRKK